jgi:hypothetical protein
MTTRDKSEIQELTDANLDRVTGGSFAHEVSSSVKLASSLAVIAFTAAYSVTMDHQPSPWA